jgi:CrcB protein
MKLWMQCLAVAAGGSLGVVARFLVSTSCARLFGTGFPVGTLVINVSGSLFLGWFVTVIQERYTISDTARLAVAVGFLGAYTTFSTFSYESNSLLEQGAGMKATFNMLGSLLFGLIAVRVGILLAAR